MDEKLIFQKLEFFQTDSLPRIHQRIDEVREDIKRLVDKVIIIDKNHSITKTQVDFLSKFCWLIITMIISGFGGIIFWLIKL